MNQYHSASPLQLLLSRLNNVRRAGNGYRADCPNGHSKTKGSLSLTETEDGRVLLCCFACGDTPGILTALGLELADLYPQPIKDTSAEGRKAAREAFKRNAWRAALSVLAREATVVVIAGRMVADGDRLTSEDDERVRLALARIDHARGVLT